MITNTEINFRGISNLKTFRKPKYSIWGSYPKINGSVGYGEKYGEEIKLYVELSNDEFGNHLDEYLEKIPGKFINNENQNHLDLLVKKYSVKGRPERYSLLKVNGKDFILNNDRKLPILTFLAKITRECANSEKYTDKQQKCLKLINASIHKIAETYFNI